jgi:hypothetical protein
MTALPDLPPLCLSGKRGFATEATARGAMAKIGRPLSGKGGKQVRRAYECPLCHEWHLTARTGKGTRR